MFRPDGVNHAFIDSPFGVASENKLFEVWIEGVSQVDLGNVLPPGLTIGELTSQLSVDGSYVGGGSLRSRGIGGPYLRTFGCESFFDVPGDFDNSQQLDAGDLGILAGGILNNDANYDLDGDADADQDDLSFWVRELKYTWIGDVDMDGQFESGDLVNVFIAAEYEDELSLNSTWATGDWNGDSEFDMSDLVFAFSDGGYERGTRDDVRLGPAPSWFGDANLDNEFNADDFISVFEAQEYEDGIPQNSDWAEGDWDGDGDFESADLVVAFIDGGFEQGRQVTANVVPEPTTFLMSIAGLMAIAIRLRVTATGFRSCV